MLSPRLSSAPGVCNKVTFLRSLIPLIPVSVPDVQCFLSSLNLWTSCALVSRSIWTRPRSIPGDGQFQGTRCCCRPSGLLRVSPRSLGVQARALLDTVGRFPDARGTSCLLRTCSGWYSCHTLRPDMQPADADTCAALTRLVGPPLSDDD